ncbi:MAG: DUF3806 domain-containing protein [Verrucomicrobiales bacterium]|nr:DUF3806 domain-containing protein [Verrucomicrobiales bacterium]
MKFFAIGDGHKRVTLPDRYETEITHDGTSIFWVPGEIDIPIRVSVLTLEPKEESEKEAGFWAVINKANSKKAEPKVVDDKSIYHYRKPEDDDSEVYHFYEIGMANYLIIVSVTVEEELENTPVFTTILEDVDNMIASIEQREEDHPFTCQLPGSDIDEISEAVAELVPGGISEESWDILQRKYDEALQDGDLDLAGKVGIVFGEMLKNDIPGFTWYLTVDDWGCARSLNFGESGVSVFPENMIVKRADDDQNLDLKELASDTIETVERVLREQ